MRLIIGGGECPFSGERSETVDLGIFLLLAGLILWATGHMVLR